MYNMLFAGSFSINQCHMQTFTMVYQKPENKGHEANLVQMPEGTIHIFQLGKPHLITLVKCRRIMQTRHCLNLHSTVLTQIYYHITSLFTLTERKATYLRKIYVNAQ